MCICVTHHCTHCHYVTVFTNRTAPIFTFIIPQMLHTSVFTIQCALWKNKKYCFRVQIKCQNSHESTGTVLYNNDIRIQNIPQLSICLYNRTDKTAPPYKPMISVPRVWVDGGGGLNPLLIFQRHAFSTFSSQGSIKLPQSRFLATSNFFATKMHKTPHKFLLGGHLTPFSLSVNLHSVCSVYSADLCFCTSSNWIHDIQLMWTGNYQFTSGCFILKVFFHLHWNRQCIDLCFWHMLQNAVTTSIL